MDALRRTSTLRRVATTASLAALVLVPAGQAEAANKKKVKLPVITSVKPMKATVGDTLTIKGRNFRKGKGKSSVAFKRDGSPVVFVKAGLSTKKMIIVKLPVKLEKVMFGKSATFHLRVLTKRFGRAFTKNRLSPTISPRPGATPPSPAVDPALPDGDCDHDGRKNSVDTDDDNDLLSDTLEDKLGTGSCDADSDGDGAADGFEYKSAVDLNDDEYQQPNVAIPFPGKRPYPNPLFKDDVNTDFDGDGLTNGQEAALWVFAIEQEGKPATLFPLSYSDGLQYSVYTVNGEGRRVPALSAAGYDRFFGSGTGTQPACDDGANANKGDEGFVHWLERCNYRTVMLHDSGGWTHHSDGSPFAEGNHLYGIFDTDRSGTESAREVFSMDRDGNRYLSDDERDEDADGLPNYYETNGPVSGASWWSSCYKDEKGFPITYAGTSVDDADTDGDGIRDGADDQDHDDVPNLMELSRIAASGAFDGTGPCTAPTPPPRAPGDPPPTYHPGAFGRVNPFNPCLPDPRSRTCPRYVEFGKEYAPFDDAPVWLSLN